MDWKEKFHVVISSDEINDEIEADFYLKDAGAKNDFLEKIKLEYPFVTDDYLNFLRMTDGADIAQCSFLETNNFDDFASQYGQTYSKKTWMPFGFEAGGDPLLLHFSGKIAMGDGKANHENVVFLANNFSDFLNNVLMGSKYASIFRIEEDNFSEFYQNEVEDDPWLAFLVKRNWVEIKKQ